MLNLLHSRRPTSLVLVMIVGMLIGVSCTSPRSDVQSEPANVSQPTATIPPVESPTETPATPEATAPQPTEPAIPTIAAAPDLPVGGSVGDLAPEFVGITNWINSKPLTMNELRGKVVLVDVWTYTCVNCIRTFPYLKEWYARYADHGLVIIGLHAPEFEFEKETANVVAAAEKNGYLARVRQPVLARQIPHRQGRGGALYPFW
jgi:thiol-disulfide isomerase/thioredoxin